MLCVGSDCEDGSDCPGDMACVDGQVGSEAVTFLYGRCWIMIFDMTSKSAAAATYEF